MSLIAKANLMQRTKDIAKISLGAEAINELLGGGLETKCITEMFGEFRHANLIPPSFAVERSTHIDIGFAIQDDC